MATQLRFDLDQVVDRLPLLQPVDDRPIVLEFDDWHAIGEQLFGSNQQDWRFECPVCSHVATLRDWKRVTHSYKEAGRTCLMALTGDCHVHLSSIDQPHPILVRLHGTLIPTFAFSLPQPKEPHESEDDRSLVSVSRSGAGEGAAP